MTKINNSAKIIVIIGRTINNDIPIVKELVEESFNVDVFPENSKHPTDIVEYVRKRIEKLEGKLLILTHSPYVITTLNNMIEAGLIWEKYPEQRQSVLEVIPCGQIISPSEIECYEYKNGEYINMRKKDTYLFSADTIDDVSDVTSSQFTDLLNIEFY